MRKVRCNNCDKKLPEAEACTSKIGWLCEPCLEARPPSADIRLTYQNNALYSFVCAAVSFVINPFGLLSIAALIFGLRALTYPKKLAEEERTYIEDMIWPKWMAAASMLAALVPLVALALDISESW